MLQEFVSLNSTIVFKDADTKKICSLMLKSTYLKYSVLPFLESLKLAAYGENIHFL